MHARTTPIHKCYKINLIYRTTHFLFDPQENGVNYDIRASEAVQKRTKDVEEEEEDAKN